VRADIVEELIEAIILDLRGDGVGNVEASKIVVRDIPDSPARSRFHTLSMECPIGVTQPIPVMTTRFIVSSI